MLDEADPAWRHRGDAVVEHPQVQALEIWEVAGHMDGHDLALAVQRLFVGAAEALQKREAARGRVTLAHDVLVGCEATDLHRDGGEGGPLVLRKGEEGDALHLANEWMGFGLSGCDHSSSPAIARAPCLPTTSVRG